MAPTMLTKKALLARLAAARGKLRAPAAAAASNRRASPVSRGRALLEEIIHPLYDTEAITADIGEYVYFQRPIGQSGVAGFLKTHRDSNLEVAGQLPSPRVHVVTGVRAVLSQVNGDTTGTVTAVAKPDMTDYMGTIRALVWESFFEFSIGSKRYIWVPLFLVPGNVGFAAIGQSQAQQGFATGATEAQWFNSVYPRGDYFSVLPARLRIPSQQGFQAKISFPRQATGDNGAWTPLKVTILLDGIQGREVQ